MSRSAVITGAGTGVGRAVALLLANKGWRIAIVGRREAALRETQTSAAELGSQMEIIVADIAQPDAVRQMSDQAATLLGSVEVLVNGAGTNIPRRSLEELSLEGYREILETNLTGAYLCTQAFLPAMRKAGRGTIVNVVSDAARQASAKAGPAYVASKFGLLGLTQSINAEERKNGIRACAILPGDINTPLLEKRPQVPDPAARSKMLQPEDVADCVWLAIQLPPRAVIEELLIRPA